LGYQLPRRGQIAMSVLPLKAAAHWLTGVSALGAITGLTHRGMIGEQKQKDRLWRFSLPLDDLSTFGATDITALWGVGSEFRCSLAYEGSFGCMRDGPREWFEIATALLAQKKRKMRSAVGREQQ
jgi:hypothetical protein